MFFLVNHYQLSLKFKFQKPYRCLNNIGIMNHCKDLYPFKCIKSAVLWFNVLEVCPHNLHVSESKGKQMTCVSWLVVTCRGIDKVPEEVNLLLYSLFLLTLMIKCTQKSLHPPIYLATTNNFSYLI